MGVMKALLLAKASAIQPKNSTQADFLSFHVTKTAVSTWRWPAALRLSPCAKMAQTWLNPSAKASAILNILALRIRIVGLVPMAPRSVSSKRRDVMGIQIVTMQLK